MLRRFVLVLIFVAPVAFAAEVYKATLTAATGAASATVPGSDTSPGKYAVQCVDNACIGSHHSDAGASCAPGTGLAPLPRVYGGSLFDVPMGPGHTKVSAVNPDGGAVSCLVFKVTP